MVQTRILNAERIVLDEQRRAEPAIISQTEEALGDMLVGRAFRLHYRPLSAPRVHTTREPLYDGEKASPEVTRVRATLEVIVP